NGGRRPHHFMATGASPQTGAPTANKEANTTYVNFENIAGALSWNHIFSPKFFVETVVNRTWQNSETVTGPEQKDWSKELGLPNPFGEIGWPNLTSLGFMNYIEGDNRRALSGITTNVEQHYTLIRGKHNFGFGWKFRHERQHLLLDQGAISGSAAFNSLATALHSPTLGTPGNPAAVPQTGHDSANFFLGYAGSYIVGLKRQWMQVTEKAYSLYGQDNYRITNRLTLTPGFRWDFNPTFKERNDLLNAFDIESHSLMFTRPLEYYYKLGVTTPQIVKRFEAVGVKFTTTDELDRPDRLLQSNLLATRRGVGYAHRLFDGNRQMVARGGYGIYISAVPMRTWLAQFSGLPPFRATFSYNPNSAAQSPDGRSNYLLRTVPNVVAGVNSANVIDLDNPNTLGIGTPVRGIADEQPSTKIHEWNLSIEKQLARNTVFRISYRGKHGVNTDQLYDINPQPNNYIWYTLTG